ncbi:MAG: response regulator [Alphaproteobacteria bacterium]
MAKEKLCVMVVDDEDAVRSALAENLVECGFEVIEARDGQEAIRLIAEGCRPLVMVTDIIMPRKEGLETIVEVRRHHPGIRLVAISGGGRSKSADFLQLAQKLGADAVMPKPVDIDELEKTVRRLAVEG